MAATAPAAGVAAQVPAPALSVAEEVAALDRVLTRLALTEDDKLEKVLQKLIPAVLGQLKSPHDATRKKVLEILSHVNKRLKGLPAMQLPLAELVSMYMVETPEGMKAASYAMVRNFALVYVEMAAERAPGPDRLAALPTLLSGIACRPAAHQAICLRIAAAALEHQPPQPFGSAVPGLGTLPGLQPQPASASGSSAAEAAVAAGEGQGSGGTAGEGKTVVAVAPIVSAAEAALRAKYPFLAEPIDRDLFLSYGLKLLLYSPRTARTPTTPLAAGQAAAAGGPAAAVTSAAIPAAAPPPPGLSAADVRQIEEKGAPSPEQVQRRKLGLLNLLAAAGIGGPPLLLPASCVLPHLLVAAVDPSEAVARRAEELLKRSACLDPSRPAADLESEELIHRLLKLFHGGSVQLSYNQNQQQGGAADWGTATAAAPDQVVTLAGPALRSRLVTVFCRSITFANTFPASLLTIQECVMPPQPQAQQGSGASAVAVTLGSAASVGGVSGVYARLRQQGLELCVWVFKHAGRHQLKAMGPVVLQGLLDTLDATAAPPGAPMDTSTMTLRGFAYQAIGSLAQRVPELLRPRTDIARRFFTALADEPPGVRAAVQEATGALSRAFVLHGAQPNNGATQQQQQQQPSSSTEDRPSLAPESSAAELDELLLESVTSVKDTVRLCAVQWACRLFPFEHVKARWVCVLAAGDTKHDVREEAARGLRPPTKPAPAAATGAAPGATAGGCASGRLPSLYALLRYVRQRLPRLRQPVDPLAPLPLPPRSCHALIALLRSCRHQISAPVANAAEERVVALAAVATARDAHSSGTGGGGDAMDFDIRTAGGGVAGGGGDDTMESEGPAVASDTGLQAADPGSVLAAYACALEAGLCRVEGSSEVAAAALEALLEAAAEDVGEAVARRYIPRVSWLRSFLGHTDPGARLAAAKLLGCHVAAVLGPEQAKALLNSLCGQLASLDRSVGSRGRVAAAAGSGFGIGGGSSPPAAVAAASAGATAAGGCTVKQEEAEGCLLAMGFMLGQAASSIGKPSLDDATTATALGILTAVLGASTASAADTTVAVSSILRATAALAISYACIAGPQPALITPLSPLPSDSHFVPAATASTAGAATATITATADTATLKAMEAEGNPGVGAVINFKPAVDAARPLPRIQLDLVGDHILDLLADKDAKVVSRAAAAAGFLAGGWGGAWGPATGLVVSETGVDSSEPGLAGPVAVSGRLLEGLFSLATNKSEDVQFVVGEALSWAFGGLPLPPSRVLRANFTNLADHVTAAADSEAGAAEELATAATPDAGAAATAMKAAEVGRPGIRALRERALDRLLGELTASPRSEIRCSSAVWLVSLLGFCGGAAELRGHALPKIQEALSGLLGDPNELTQEMASRGVSLVYRLGDDKVREQLVGSLVAVLGGGGAGSGTGRPVKLTADTQVFEEGALGAAPGGSGGGGSAGGSGGAGSGGGLSTYKELCALATDLGQPDLIYKFMDLAHHAAALNSRRGAAFGFAGIARLAARGGGGAAAGAALAKHLAALVPKLYRYTHDPNPKVAEAMAAIWRSLVDDPRTTLDMHFGPVMMDLLREMGGRLWRNRQAACAAMADLLQGRRWPELVPYFSQIWVMTFRAMDDIKDSVRRAALSLARTVRGLTLRLADSAHTPARECAAAVSAVMPILLEQGLPSTVAEVRALSVEVLGLISKAAPPAALRPLLPALVPALLEALSSLEDVRLNYVEQHAERLGLDYERLEGARVAAARATPLGDTLDLAARLADGPSLEALVPALVGTVKRGVGLNTKVGTARFIRNLASRPGALATTGAASSTEGSLMRPHAGALLRVLSAAVRSERSGMVRRAYAASAAQVVRHAGDKRLDKFVAEALASYSDPGADVDSRLSGGLLLRELLRAAPEKLRMYDAAVLPAAFGAKMDEDKDVAATWAEIWEEGVSSEPAALRLYGKEICTTLCEMLGGQQWGRKKAAAVATVKLTEIAPDALGEHGRHLCTALLSELAVGRLWEGKEAVVRALGALVAADARVMEAAPGHAAVVDALLAAVARRKLSYRTAALEALEVVLRALPGDHYGRVATPLLAAVTRHSEAGSTVAAAASDGTATTTTTAAAAPAATATSSSAAATDDDTDRPLPLTECLSCLAAAFSRVGAANIGEVVSEHGVGMASALQGVLSAQLPWQPKLAAAQAVTVLAQRCSACRMPPAAAAALLGPLTPGLVQSALDHKVQQFRLAALSALNTIVQAVAPSRGPAPVVNTMAITATAAAASTAAGTCSGTDLPDAAAAAASAAAAMGWSDQQRLEVLPRLVSGLQQLAEADKAAAVVAAALGIKSALEPLIMSPAAAVAAAEAPKGSEVGATA